jgi:hypothetical protein
MSAIVFIVMAAIAAALVGSVLWAVFSKRDD